MTVREMRSSDWVCPLSWVNECHPTLKGCCPGTDVCIALLYAYSVGKYEQSNISDAGILSDEFSSLEHMAKKKGSEQAVAAHEWKSYGDTKQVPKESGVRSCFNTTKKARYANRLKEVRRARKLTQAELAEQSGVARPFISEIETGAANPTVATALKLAQVLGCTMDCLFSLGEEESA